MVQGEGTLMEEGVLTEIIERIAPYKTLVVELYGDNAPVHENAEIFSKEGNLVKYRFKKDALATAELIRDLSAQVAIKDAAIEEADIDDIIRIAYRQGKDEET